jgi:hypothetical protein
MNTSHFVPQERRVANREIKDFSKYTATNAAIFIAHTQIRLSIGPINRTVRNKTKLCKKIKKNTALPEP